MKANTILKRVAASVLGYGLIAAFCLPVPQVSAAITVYYLSHDRQGSLTDVIDSENQATMQQSWNTWGQRVDPSNENTRTRFTSGYPMRWGYTGHKQLMDSDLVLGGDTRLYDPDLQRFYNTDDRTTGDVRGMNRLSYAYNNPLAFVDPDGHAPMRIYGTSNRLPTNEFISAVVEVPSYSEVFLNQLHTQRDRQLEEKRFLEVARDPNDPPEEVYIQPTLTLGTPVIAAPISGRAVSLLPGHTNLIVHAMGWTDKQFLQNLARLEFGAGSNKGRFVGGGFIISNTGDVLIHPWHSFKAAGFLMPQAIEYWKRHTKKKTRKRYPLGQQITVNASVVQYPTDADLGVEIPSRHSFMPVAYWEQYINAISERTQAPISIEPFESNRFTWYEGVYGPRRAAMIQMMRGYPQYFSAMETYLPQLVESANQRVFENRR